MANSLLTIDMITRETLVVLHQEANFIGSVNRQYDNTFGEGGVTPKIGSNLRVRLPNEYKVRTGATLSTQDTEEQKVDVPVKTQKGVDLNFTSADLALSIEEFSDRYIRPAVSVLVSNIEADFYQDVYKEVSNLVDNDGNVITFKNILQGRKRLVDNLTPSDGTWTAMLSTDHSVELVDSLKGLFQSSTQIANQYEDGIMGRAGGFMFRESTHFTPHTTGTSAEGDTTYNINGANQGSSAAVSTLTVDTGTTTFLEGDIITIAGVNRVHPETKRDTGELMQFVVTADSGTSATSLAISPALNAVTTDGKQNVASAPADNAAINKIGAGNGETLSGTMLYHPNAFTFATADLPLPSGVDMAAREVLDGISVRLVRQYDINNDKFPCRLDILPAYKATRPKLAVRVHADG